MTPRTTDAGWSPRATSSQGGYGNAERPPAPLPVDVALVAEYTAGVMAARDEYAAHPITNNYGGEKRDCIDCGKTHRQRFTAYCSRCRRKPRERT